MKGEIRQDITTGDWVIIAPGRGERPSDFNRERPSLPRGPSRDPGCPFCPGNEDQIPPILEEIPDGDGGWLTRVIPNKYPILFPRKWEATAGPGLFQSRPASGRHEIIIETPRHDVEIEDLTLPHLAAILETYRSRYRAIRTADPESRVIIFRNRGRTAGTSLVHPHSQLIATRIDSPRTARKEETARTYFQKHRRCVYCDLAAAEAEEGRRTVISGEKFLAFIPFAAEVPFETWIIPRAHCPEFGETGRPELRELAGIFRGILRTLKISLGEFDYNYSISPPFLSRDGEAFSHWHLRIRPRLTTLAGFEIETGTPVNPDLPEEDAALLLS